MGTGKLDTEIRQEQIAQAALSLVASQGMKGLSVAGVARIVSSAIYRHFKSKDQILDAVLDLLRGKLFGNVKSVIERSPDPLKRLKWLLILHVRLIREYQAMPRILFSEEVYGGHPERKAKLHGIITEYLNEVASMVRQGQKERCIRPDINPETVSLMFLGLFQPSAFLWHLSDGGFDVTKSTQKRPGRFSVRRLGLNLFGLYSPPLAASSSFRRKPESRESNTPLLAAG